LLFRDFVLKKGMAEEPGAFLRFLASTGKPDGEEIGDPQIALSLRVAEGLMWIGSNHHSVSDWDNFGYRQFSCCRVLSNGFLPGRI
jgi:hypothetical protein